MMAIMHPCRLLVGGPLLGVVVVVVVVSRLPTPALAAVKDHSTIDSIARQAGFVRHMSSFDAVDLFGTAQTPVGALQHAACVLDQYLDQDRDGVVDDPSVLAQLRARRATMIMGATYTELIDSTNMEVFPAACDNRVFQMLFADDTAWDDSATHFDASLEEVLHLITHHGYANAYPDVFGEYSGTTLANAIDQVIGDCEMAWECGSTTNDITTGQPFCENSGFSEQECVSYSDSWTCECGWDNGQCWWRAGPCTGGSSGIDNCQDYDQNGWISGSCTGKFHYSDNTCDYGCLLTEGLYWGVSSLLGVQENRCQDISHEWEPCTPASMRTDADALSSLVDTMGVTAVPDGNCIVSVDHNNPPKSFSSCDAPPKSFFCYAPSVTTRVNGKGLVPMKDLKVGDKVLTANGTYRTVYAVDHFHKTRPTEFLQIRTTMENEKPLEVTSYHMIYVEGKSNPVPAHFVKIGDFVRTLTNHDGGGAAGYHQVTKIERVVRNGFYNVLTMDGTIVVDGIVGSTYPSLSGTEYIEVWGVPWLSHQDFLHTVSFPLRTALYYMVLPLFQRTSNVAEIDNEYFAWYDQWYNAGFEFFRSRNSFVQGLVVLVFSVGLAILSALSWLLTNPLQFATATVSFATVFYYSYFVKTSAL